MIGAAIENGDRIAQQTPRDYLIICGVSNLGGMGMLAALAAPRPDMKRIVADGLTRERDRHDSVRCSVRVVQERFVEAAGDGDDVAGVALRDGFVEKILFFEVSVGFLSQDFYDLRLVLPDFIMLFR